MKFFIFSVWKNIASLSFEKVLITSNLMSPIIIKLTISFLFFLSGDGNQLTLKVQNQFLTSIK